MNKNARCEIELIRDGKLCWESSSVEEALKSDRTGRKRCPECHASVRLHNAGVAESGSLTKKHANRGVFITTSFFSKDALEYIEEMPQRIILIDGRRLASLMIEHNVGVAPAKMYTLKRLDQDYFENL